LEDIPSSLPPPIKPAAVAPALQGTSEGKPAVVNPVDGSSDPCQALPAGISLPYYLSGPSVVVMGFLKTCQMTDGREGFVKGSSWTAMGFPCSAGRGRIDKKGSDSVPSVVTFHLQNSCPMQPSRPEDIEVLARQKLGIPVDSRLIAYYPLSVDYWEFVDFSEHDTGYRPKLFIPASIANGWQKFTAKGEAIKIRLYGRENAWEPGKKLYEVEATLHSEGRSTFRLRVNVARPIDDQKRKAVSDRCGSLRPKRGCEEIFGL